MRGSHTSIVRQTKQNTATIGASLVVLGLPQGALWPWVCDMPSLDLDEVVDNKKTVLHDDIFMEGSHTRIVRRTEQNAAILGVSLVVFGLPQGALRP